MRLAFDFRDCDFGTMRELHDLVDEETSDLCEDHRAEAFVVIGERQLKLLRLECYERGMPEEDVLIMEPEMVCDLPVVVIWNDGTYRCLDCEQLHKIEDL